ncbi:hypothetical protein [Senegalia massiliensis]|uniref:hypothetical protein n=1 Tax=Senegalia massiliensis TaxID=1720316 RepID=UPI0010306EF2|nr:hypothetical protein [Senegalia massiliensis]
MESRLERYLKEKKNKKRKRIKILIISLMVILLVVAISIVNDSLYNYFDLTDTSVFNYEYEKSTHVIEIFGNEFDINLNKAVKNIKEYIVNIF